MQTKLPYVLIDIGTKGEVGPLRNRFKPSSKIFILWIIYVISVWFLLCFRVHLIMDALWSHAGIGLPFWLLFVMSICDVVTLPVVSWVRCGA